MSTGEREDAGAMRASSLSGAGGPAPLGAAPPGDPEILVDVVTDAHSGAASGQSSPRGAALEAPKPATPLAAALPTPPAGAPVTQPTPEQAQRAKERIDSLVKEARATLGPEAAALWFEGGRLYESELFDFKNAAGHYQESHKADPTFVPVIHAARRLFAQLGKHGMVVVLIDEELKLPGAPSTALLVEKARIHETKLARPEDAVSLYQQALAVNAGYAPAIDGIVRHLEQRASWADVVKVLRAGAAATSRPSQRGAWLTETGRILEARLKDDAGALEAYEKADAESPGRRSVLEALRRLYARKGDAHALGDVLDRLADTAGSPAEAVTFLTERARMLAAGNDEKQAIAALEQAREKAPDDALILSELARLYERLEMWPSLVETLEAHARGTHDRAELLALFAEAGKLAEERLEDPERAIRLYGSCVEVDPSYTPALTALGKLFSKTKRFRELSSVYEVQIGATVDPLQKVSLLFKHAELLAAPPPHGLDDPTGALERLAEILKIQNGWVPALKMTSALLSRLERYEETLGETLADALLRPHKSYLAAVQAAMRVGDGALMAA